MSRATAFNANVAVHSADEMVLTVRGDIDASTAPALREAVNTIPVSDVRLVVDLSGVTFMDSSGLSVLAVAAGRLQRSGGTLLIRGAPPPVRRLLQITGLDEFFASDETRPHRPFYAVSDAPLQANN